jgi:hypothetical protein
VFPNKCQPPSTHQNSEVRRHGRRARIRLKLRSRRQRKDGPRDPGARLSRGHDRCDGRDRRPGGDCQGRPGGGGGLCLLGHAVNLRGLSIDSVRATISAPGEDRRELLVTGEIVNLRQVETPVPSLRLTLFGEGRRELYLWTAREPKSALGPHERVAFRARLAAPPAGVRDVLVKFAAPGDKASFTE